MKSIPQFEVDLQFRKIWLGLGYALLVAIAVLSLIPLPEVGESDKLLHFSVYALLSGWFSLIVKYPRSLWLVFIGLIFFGLLMEYAQGLTSYRMQDINDAIANSLGVMVGIFSRFSPLRGVLTKIDKHLQALL